jgi:hypothetical protein
MQTLLNLGIYRGGPIASYVKQYQVQPDPLKPISLRSSHSILLSPTFFNGIMGLQFDC